jgi:hypothetical protein
MNEQWLINVRRAKAIIIRLGFSRRPSSTDHEDLTGFSKLVLREAWGQIQRGKTHETLRNRLRETGISQKKLAPILGLSRPYLNQYMNGEKVLSPQLFNAAWAALEKGVLPANRETGL